MKWLFYCWLLLLAACTSAPPVAGDDAPLQASPFAGWEHRGFPGKRATAYAPTLDGGTREAIEVRAESSASMLRQTLRIEPADLGQVRFSWKVPALIAQADLGQRDKADAPVRVVLAFEGDRSRLSLKDAMVSELAHALTGEPMPYATLMYVWCNTRAPGTLIPSTHTSRIQKLVVESGPERLNQWLDYERDIRTDYQRAFGEPPGALVGVAIMTDTDNTRSSARAWYGPVRVDGLLTAER